MLLSHAHIDHSGNFPTLVKNGFGGPICSTSATAGLCHAMLRDTAHIQESDAAFVNKRGARRRLEGPLRGQNPASLVLDYRTKGARVRLAFSSDVGRPNLPIARPPYVLPVGYLILEST